MLPACSSTSIFLSDTGGRAMCCARASRVLEEGALQEEGDHAGAEVLTELRQIEGWHVDELSLPVASL